MGFPAIVSGLMVLLLFACFVPTAVPLAYEYSTLHAWYATAVTPIGSAQVGQSIKVSGIISSESSYAYPVALSGQEVRGRGCTWNLDEGAQFTVADTSRTIVVTVSRYWEIADGPHPNPYRTCAIAESQYHVGDPIVVSGTVASDSSGRTILQAFIVSPDSAHPLPNFLGWAIVTPFLALCVVLWVRIAILSRTRLALHRKSLEGKLSMPVPISPDPKDPSLPWQRTFAVSALLDRGRYVVLFAAVPWALPALYVWLVSPHSQNEYYIAALIASASAFLLVTILFTALVSRVKPSAMAVTQVGIHFWYERPADRYELDSLVRWTDLTDVRMVPVGKTLALALVMSSGEKKTFPGLVPAVRNTILAGWKDRASLPSPPGLS